SRRAGNRTSGNRRNRGVAQRRRPTSGAVHRRGNASTVAHSRNVSMVARRILRGSETAAHLVGEGLVVGVEWIVVRVCPGGSRAIRAPLDREDDAYSFG